MNKSYINYGIVTGKSKYRRRIGIRRSILIVAVLIIIVFISIPFIAMDKFVNMHVDHMDLYEAKDFGLTSEKLSLRTSDGISIVAHEVYMKNPKAVVILLSGIHNPSVTALFGHSSYYCLWSIHGWINCNKFFC